LGYRVNPSDVDVPGNLNRVIYFDGPDFADQYRAAAT
jgi:hypothetical protein